MKSLVLSAMLAIAGATGIAVLAPQPAVAQWGGPPPPGYGYGGPGWGGPGWHHRRPPPPPYYGYGGPPRRPACWMERRVVDTPWGPRMQRVRICR